MSSRDAEEQLGFTFRPPERRVWTVRDLVRQRGQLSNRTTAMPGLKARFSNFKPAESGHLYFTLKDGAAQLSLVMFRSQARLLRFRPQDGMQIIARGRVTIYEGRGQLQLIAEYLEPKGAGALQIAFEQLKARLETEGLFRASARRPSRPFPYALHRDFAANRSAARHLEYSAAAGTTRRMCSSIRRRFRARARQRKLQLEFFILIANEM